MFGGGGSFRSGVQPPTGSGFNPLIPDQRKIGADQTQTPCARIAFATFTKPAMFAPAT